MGQLGNTTPLLNEVALKLKSLFSENTVDERLHVLNLYLKHPDDCSLKSCICHKVKRLTERLMSQPTHLHIRQSQYVDQGTNQDPEFIEDESQHSQLVKGDSTLNLSVVDQLSEATDSAQEGSFPLGMLQIYICFRYACIHNKT